MTGAKREYKVVLFCNSSRTPRGERISKALEVYHTAEGVGFGHAREYARTFAQNNTLVQRWQIYDKGLVNTAGKFVCVAQWDWAGKQP